MSQLAGLVEVEAVFILIILQIWVFGRGHKTPTCLAIAIVAAGWLARRETLEKLGLLEWAYFLPAVALFIVRPFFRELFLAQNGFPKKALFLVAYFPWALAQQSVLNGFFARRLYDCGLGKIITPLAAGLIFSLLHLPNPLLAPLTLLGGTASSAIFLRMPRRNLYPLAAIHAVVAAIFYFYCPAEIHHNFKIGWAYFQWTAGQK